MPDVKVTTKVLGELEFPSDDGLFEDVRLSLAGGDVAFTLCIMEEVASDECADEITRLIDSAERIYEAARNAISEDGSGVASDYAAYHLDELSEETLARVVPAGDGKATDHQTLLSALCLRSMTICQDSNEERPEGWLDFGLDDPGQAGDRPCRDLREVSQYVLVVRFDTQGEIVDLDMES